MSGHRPAISAALELQRPVRPVRLEHDRRVGCHRSEGVDNSQQRFVVDHHQLSGVCRGARGYGRHHRDRVAHISGFVGQRQPAELRRHHGEQPLGRDGEIRGCEDSQDPRTSPRVVGVDCLDSGVGHDRPHEGQMHGSGRSHVCYVAGCSGQQVGILAPQHGVSHHRC